MKKKSNGKLAEQSGEGMGILYDPSSGKVRERQGSCLTINPQGPQAFYIPWSMMERKRELRKEVVC
jgi:hypothetical protein